MKAVIAIDSFKGSLSTFEAGKAVAEGIRLAYPDAVTVISPLADGGEGTVDAVITATEGIRRKTAVWGPLGDKVEAEYGIIPRSKTAVMEMAAAAGITLIESERRNPLYTTTYGVGQMIADAIDLGCREFVMGIGGSATNDGGIGMLQALGFEFLDKAGNPVARGGIGLKDICTIRTENANPLLKECRFRIACDVSNTLCGEKGCSAVYGPQKGATPEMVKNMDMWLLNYADLTLKATGKGDKDYAGAGAAGGLGFAFLSYLNSTLQSGIEIVMSVTGLAEKIADADIVITGEGRLDGQSYMGKAPVGVAKLAKSMGKQVIAFAGGVTEDARKCNEFGIDAFFPIVRQPCTLEKAMESEFAYGNLTATAEQVFRLIKAQGTI